MKLWNGLPCSLSINNLCMYWFLHLFNLLQKKWFCCIKASAESWEGFWTQHNSGSLELHSKLWWVLRESFLSWQFCTLGLGIKQLGSKYYIIFMISSDLSLEFVLVQYMLDSVLHGSFLDSSFLSTLLYIVSKWCWCLCIYFIFHFMLV